MDQTNWSKNADHKQLNHKIEIYKILNQKKIVDMSDNKNLFCQ